MILFNSRFYNPGNPRPLYRKRWIQTPYQKPNSTCDDTIFKLSGAVQRAAMKASKKSAVEAGKKRPTQKFYVNPFRFASLFGNQAPTKLSVMKNFKGPDVIDTQKQPIKIEVDLRTVCLRNDTLRKQDNHISRFIKCFHHAQSVTIRNSSDFGSLSTIHTYES